MTSPVVDDAAPSPHARVPGEPPAALSIAVQTAYPTEPLTALPTSQERIEVTALASGPGAVFLVGAGVLALKWFGRLP